MKKGIETHYALATGIDPDDLIPHPDQKQMKQAIAESELGIRPIKEAVIF